LWVASLTSPTAVSNVRPVEGVNEPSIEQHPWVSADELMIVFDSTRDVPEAARTNLWQATRSDVGQPFSGLRPLAALNTNSVDEGPGLTADGLMIFFASDRPGSIARPGTSTPSQDVWVATRTSLDAPFTPAKNLAVVNSPEADVDVAVTPDGQQLFFSSSRDQLPQQLYQASRVCR
jgi:Tol biopolymer transport system component